MPRRPRTLLLALVLVSRSRSSAAVVLSCLQRAFGLLTPCQPCFRALSTAPTTTGGGIDINAALASLGGSLTSLPPSVSQCCAALSPINAAKCAPCSCIAMLASCMH